jgi:hypothetical protein
MQPAEAGIDQDLTIDDRQAREDPMAISLAAKPTA